ncbi:MAG: DUF4340 domain-containing protein [SAR324 cluster bacterium]|nr:DUF4340 domain-containing protein [SAR324 cluster bacterium]
MNNRRIFYTVILIILVSVGVFFFGKYKGDTFKRDGQPLISSGTIKNYDEISIVTQQYKVKLKLDQSGIWVVADSNNFPADAARIYQLFDDLATTNYFRLVAQGKDNFAKFGLEKNAGALVSDGVVITFSKDSTSKKGLFFGNLRATEDKPRAGQYFREAGKEDIYLVSRALLLPDLSGDWLNNNLITWPSDNLAEVNLSKGKTSFTFSQNSDDGKGDNGDVDIDGDIANNSNNKIWQLKGSSEPVVNDKFGKLLSFINPLKVDDIFIADRITLGKEFFTLIYQTKSAQKLTIKVYRHDDKELNVTKDNYLMSVNLQDILPSSELSLKKPYYDKHLFSLPASKVEDISFDGYTEKPDKK